MVRSNLDLQPSPRLLQVLGDIPLAPWQCIAELVDNSLDELLKDETRSVDNPLTIDIEVRHEQGGTAVLTVSDNGSGMAEDDLERSLRAGHSGKGRYGSLGLFGMGFNIATARMGDVTHVSTTTLGSTEQLTTTIDFRDLQRRESFSVPLRRDRVDAASCGTKVEILLNRSMADTLVRPQQQKTVLSQLGDIYSFLLRESVPGLSRNSASSRIPARITFNGQEVVPRLPCIWADTRSTTYAGQEIDAVQYVNLKLSDATACLSCGFWDRKNGPEACDECGSKNLEQRDREIWGWLGVQRYLDSKRYGIDFIRYGRKILKDDKSVFIFEDPDTLESDVEYPIEMPANQGRLVGEIHLDHVPVTYQKNDFDRSSRDWQTAIEHIRGSQPLKPRKSAASNGSPLATLFSAFRRSDPGLKCLTPGDGKKAILVKAREWGGHFEKGVARYRDDTEWYEAAARHDAIKNGSESPTDEPSSPGESGEADSGGDKIQPSARERHLGGNPISSPTASPNPAAPSDKRGRAPLPTRAQALEAARLVGHERSDLGGTFNLSAGLGSWTLKVVSTAAGLTDDTGGTVPVVPGNISGKSLEVLVAREHPIFLNYGRDVRDVALLQAAVLIRDLSASQLPATTVYAELVQQIEDLKETPGAILERTHRTVSSIAARAFADIGASLSEEWVKLPVDHKVEIEGRAAVRYPQEQFSAVVDSGQFILVSGAAALASLISHNPEQWFDGRVFRPSISHRSNSARERLVNWITSSLLSIASFEADDLMRGRHETRQVLLSLDVLDEQLIDEFGDN